ncbi:MAG TPA: flippase-like domain-containing protein [Firmicutes bacterium]|nr:flippase-like domain-containing protein [Bacillota bacterium]
MEIMQSDETTAKKIPWKGIIAAFLCSTLALALVFARVAKPADVLRELEHYPLGYFLLAALAVFFSWLIDGQRIGILAASLGFQAPWWQLGLLLGAANFLTLVTPFAGGGGALIIYFLYRRGLSIPQATAIVITGGIASQISLAALAILILPNLRTAPAHLAKYLLYLQLLLLLYVLALIAVLYLAARPNRLANFIYRRRQAQDSDSPSRAAVWLEEFQTTCKKLAGLHGRSYLGALAIAFLYYLVYYLAGFILLSGFGVFSGIFRYAISILLGIAPVFSPIPGGAGAAELVAYFVLEGALPADVLGTFIVLWRSVVFYIPILIGGSIFTFFAFKWGSKAKESPSPR